MAWEPEDNQPATVYVSGKPITTELSRFTFREYIAECEKLHGAKISLERRGREDQLLDAWEAGESPNDFVVQMHYQAARAKADRNV